MLWVIIAVSTVASSLVWGAVAALVALGAGRAFEHGWSSAPYETEFELLADVRKTA